MKFTIILPIYGYSAWLDEAIDSVIDQQSRSWDLLIADDGADQATNSYLQSKLSGLITQEIRIVKREKNIGLFANLNKAIIESKNEWVLLLCSDDRLHKHAISELERLHNLWPEAGLILSSFESINANGSLRPNDSDRHHIQLSKVTGLVDPQKMIPALLELGSLNGNLTGMAFSKEHWCAAGPFREDWRHAADWEWLIRASEKKALLLNRAPIASVRTHEQQLSVRNRQSGHECQEVGAVVSLLMHHPLLEDIPDKNRWAGHVMQFQLWNLIKGTSQANWRQWPTGLRSIHKSAGLRQTCMCLLRWMPARWNNAPLTRASKA